MQISIDSINALVGVINQSIYRSGPNLVDIFNRFGYEHTYPESVNERGSRDNYTRENLKQLNGTAKLDEIVEWAIHPRNYIESTLNVEDVVDTLNQYLVYDGIEIIQDNKVYKVKYSNQQQPINLKNLIFAATGPKPVIVLVDTLTYEIDVVEHKENVLIYDKPILSDGLSWREVIRWWSDKYQITNDVDHQFFNRLYQSLNSVPEQLFFCTYYSLFNPNKYENFPILIPQVYLHYDPNTIRQLGGQRRIPRQRMDFLLLLPMGTKIVIEIDGKQHYSDSNTNLASPLKYAEMVSEDRRLKLNGYNVYRFGGHELMNGTQYQLEQSKELLRLFFNSLFEKHDIRLNER